MTENRFTPNRAFSMLALFAGYLIIIIGIVLQQNDIFGVTIGWVFLFFLLCAGMFYFFRIDSRFLILTAAILLLLCPFLLIYGLDKLAEIISLYFFYFLVLSLALGAVELRSGYKKSIRMQNFRGFISEKTALYLAVFWALFFAASYFMGLKPAAKAVSLYLCLMALVVHVFSGKEK